jgi:hypothetical protein
MNFDYSDKEIEFSELKGSILERIFCEIGGRTITFETYAGEIYLLFHVRGCCERVEIIDIIGDLEDIIGEPILMAEKVTSQTDIDGLHRPWLEDSSFTWSFYKLATIKGSVTIRWYGASNGYYSEEVDFIRIVK